MYELLTIKDTMILPQDRFSQLYPRVEKIILRILNSKIMIYEEFKDSKVLIKLVINMSPTTIKIGTILKYTQKLLALMIYKTNNNIKIPQYSQSSLKEFNEIKIITG